MKVKKLIPLLLLLGAVGCGMSEGQNAVLYLGSVTVQERRLEADAHQIEAILDNAKSGELDRQALSQAILHAKETAAAGQEELNKTRVPQSAVQIHSLYQKMFEASTKNLELATQMLKADSPSAEQMQKFQSTRAEIAQLEKQILDEKRKLSTQYQEVQLPEASPSTASGVTSAS